MLQNILKHYWLLLVLIFGLILFTYKLNSIPSGVWYDEAVVGYNAFSISKTLRDEYGKLLPIYFKFFGSYTPGLYVYFLAPLVKLFGLSTFLIRLPSALFTLIIGIFLYYFLIDHKLTSGKQVSALSVFLFFISPWVVLNARLGYETTFAFTLFSLGVFFYKKPYLSFFLLSLSTYAAHTERYLSPLVLIIIFFLFHKNVRTLVFATLIQIPNIILMFTPAFWVKNTSFTNNFLAQYLSYFSPINLFIKGDYDLQRSILNLGVFFNWYIVPITLGLIITIKNARSNIFKLILGLLILSPIPATLGNTSFSTQRALPLLLPYALLLSIGTNFLFNKIKPIFLSLLILLLVSYSLNSLYKYYFENLPIHRAKNWSYGFQDLVNYIKEYPNKRFTIDSNNREIPYIQILYFLKYSPSKYIQENNFQAKDYYYNTVYTPERSIGNIQIKKLDWSNNSCQENILIGDPLSISNTQIKEHKLQVLKMFYYPDGSFAHLAVLQPGSYNCQQ